MLAVKTQCMVSCCEVKCVINKMTRLIMKNMSAVAIHTCLCVYCHGESTGTCFASVSC